MSKEKSNRHNEYFSYYVLGGLLYLATAALSVGSEATENRSEIVYGGNSFSVASSASSFVDEAKKGKRVAIAFMSTEMRKVFQEILKVSQELGINASTVMEPSQWINADTGTAMSRAFAMSHYMSQHGQVTSGGIPVEQQSSNNYYYFISKPPYSEDEEVHRKLETRSTSNKGEIYKFLIGLMNSERDMFFYAYHFLTDETDAGYDKIRKHMNNQQLKSDVYILKFQDSIIIFFDRENLAYFDTILRPGGSVTKIYLGHRTNDHFSHQRGLQFIRAKLAEQDKVELFGIADQSSTLTRIQDQSVNNVIEPGKIQY